MIAVLTIDSNRLNSDLERSVPLSSQAPDAAVEKTIWSCSCMLPWRLSIAARNTVSWGATGQARATAAVLEECPLFFQNLPVCTRHAAFSYELARSRCLQPP